MRKLPIMTMFNSLVHSMLRAMGATRSRGTILDQKLAAKRAGYTRRRSGKDYPYASLRQNTRVQRKLLRKLREATD